MEGARPASAADIEPMQSVNARRRAEIEAVRGGELYLRREADPSPIGPLLQRSIADEATIVVVGTYDEVVFGYGLAVVETLRDGAKLARLDHFVVDAEARKSGIGEAMMNLIVEQAEAAGCIGIDSIALPGDRDTKNFFESFGLKARMLTVHRSLGSCEADG